LHNWNIIKEKWAKVYPQLTKKLAMITGTTYRITSNTRNPLGAFIYTTNTVEGFHRMLRKATKTKGAFTNENALSKIIYLTILQGYGKMETASPQLEHGFTSQFLITLKTGIKA